MRLTQNPRRYLQRGGCGDETRPWCGRRPNTAVDVLGEEQAAPLVVGLRDAPHDRRHFLCDLGAEGRLELGDESRALNLQDLLGREERNKGTKTANKSMNPDCKSANNADREYGAC